MVGRDIHWNNRIEQGGVAPGFCKRRAHSGNVDQSRAAGRIVHQHPVRQKRNFNLAATGFKPVDHRRFRPCSVVFSGAKHILQQYPMNIRHARQTVARLCGKIDDIVADAVYLEFRSHIVVVERHGHPRRRYHCLLCKSRFTYII